MVYLIANPQLPSASPDPWRKEAALAAAAATVVVIVSVTTSVSWRRILAFPLGPKARIKELWLGKSTTMPLGTPSPRVMVGEAMINVVVLPSLPTVATVKGWPGLPPAV